jgi:hypothetical protein
VPDPSVVEFKKQMASFIKEARALARYLHEGNVDPNTYDARYEALNGLRMHMPEPPSAPGYEEVFDQGGVVDKEFNQEGGVINYAYGLAATRPGMKFMEILNNGGKKRAAIVRPVLDAMEKDLAALK